MKRTIFLITILALSIFLAGCSEKAGQATIQQANEFEKLDSTLSKTTDRGTNHAILATQIDTLRSGVDSQKKDFDAAFSDFNKGFDLANSDIEKVRMLIEKSKDQELIEAFKDFDSDFQASRDYWAGIEKTKSDFDTGYLDFMTKSQDFSADAIGLEGDLRFTTAKVDNVRATALRVR